MKRVKYIITFFIIVLSFFTSSIKANAMTLRQAYNELATLEKNYNAAQNRANLSQAELKRLKASIASTEAEIKQAQQDIVAAENEIQRCEKEIEKKKEEINQMLLYLQIMNSHGDSMLEYVMDADNYTDFIYRYSVVTQMSDYNQELMNQLEKIVNELNEKKKQLKQKQENLAKKKNDLQAKYMTVQIQYKNSQDEGLSMADQIAEKKKLINTYKARGCKMDQDVNNCNNAAAVTGWTYPLNSFYQSSSYAERRGSVYHYAVDLAVGEGSAVKAVANGEVVSAQVGRGGCGGMIVQIRHSYQGTYYLSLYMHLISTNVGVGTKVSGGQVIGTSGGGPIEQRKWGDSCTSGAHLHFAMATASSIYDLIGYSSERGSTFNPVRFFPAMKGEGARYNY